LFVLYNFSLNLGLDEIKGRSEIDPWGHAVCPWMSTDVETLAAFT
jgi:hypothetical protein